MLERPVSRLCRAIKLIRAVAVACSLLAAFSLSGLASEAVLPASTAIKIIAGSIEGLRLNLFKVEVLPKNRILLHGTFKQPQSVLLLDQNPIAVAADGSFQFELPIPSKASSFVLNVVDAKGNLQTQSFEIGQGKDTGNAAQHRFAARASIGDSYISYNDSRIATLSEMALTAKLALSARLPWKSWELGLSGYLTVLPLSDSLPNTSLRFYGLNLRVGYDLPFVHPPWKLSLQTGGYYTSSNVTTPVQGMVYTLGFSNIAGPQLFPMLSRAFSSGSVVSAYLKYSPVSNNLPSLSFSNYEAAGGASYLFGIGSIGTFSVSVDVSYLTLVIAPVTISTNSATLSIGYGF